MRLELYYDTESTGIPDYRAPSIADHQPHVVAIGALLVDTEPKEWVRLASLEMIVKPEGWIIPDETVRIHGITQDTAMACGVPENVALSAFYRLWEVSHTRVGYNEAFDARMVRIGLLRHFSPTHAKLFEAGKSVCIAKTIRDYVYLEPTERMKKAGMKVGKTPSLGEAFRELFDEPMPEAHTVLGDVNAAMALRHYMLHNPPPRRRAHG